MSTTPAELLAAWRAAERRYAQAASGSPEANALHAEMRRLMDEYDWATRTALAEFPDGDRIRVFDAYRARVLTLPDAITAASPGRREELCRIVVQRVVVRDRQVEAIEWTLPVRPFFEKQRECPQGDSNP